MKRLQKRKGITLVEVLISLILIGVIAAGLLTFFAGSYHNILGQRKQNTINFDIQQDFETRLSEIKKNSGKGTEVETFSYRIGNGSLQNIKVTGQTLSYNKNNQTKNIHLFAANAKESVLQIPEDLDVKVPDSKRFYYIGETTKPGSVGLADSQQGSKARIYTESGWFLSDRSIGNGLPGIVPVGTIGQVGDTIGSATVLPEMPTDFRQLSKKGNGVYITDNMRGRYLTFAARVINSYGRVGNYQEAERIWVMGLPVTNNLDIHTDADLALLKKNSTFSMLPSDGQIYTNTDIRDYAHDKSFDSFNIFNVPVLNYYEDVIRQSRQFIAPRDKYSLTFEKRDFRNGNSNTTSILIGNRTQIGSLLTYKLDNTLSWAINLEDSGKIAIKTVDNTAANNGGQQYANAKLDFTKDNSIQVRSSTKNDILTLEIFVNGALAHTQQLFLNQNGVRHNVETGQIVFGGNTYINEFAIYKTSLNDGDIQKLAKYFSEKYKASE